MADYILAGESKLTYKPLIVTVGSESLLPQQKEKIVEQADIERVTREISILR